MTPRGWLRSRRYRATRKAKERLRIVFQPIRDLADGTVVGYEALSRFDSGAPEAWFNQAHELGLGVEMELAAIKRALALAPDDWGYVSVNLSPTTAIAPAFFDLVSELSDPSRLVLELTEHTAVNDYRRLTAVLAELRSGGVRIAVDDVGGGISSFRHILMIAPDMIKLDRSLIATLQDDPRRRALADLMAQFCDRIGATLVAEGIERVQERTACLEHGIWLGQGYLLGRPLDITEIEHGVTSPLS